MKPVDITHFDQTVSKSKGYGLGRFSEGRYGAIYLEHQILEAHETLMHLIGLLDQRLE
jgi:hypothetical protein